MCGISRLPCQPGRRGFAGQFIQDITAAAIAPPLRPRTMQLPFDGHTGAGR
jgi:hypothetical protein